MRMSAYPLVSDYPDVQAAYEAMRNRGESHAVAEMLALGAAPQAVTDSTFLSGFGANGGQFEGRPEVGDHYAGLARAAGVDPKGKVYLGGLAEYPGDPRAWVDGRGDVERLCSERGWGCQGSVTVKRDRSAEPPPPVDVADDLLEGEVQSVAAAEPERARTAEQRAELKETIRARRRPHWAKQ